MMLPATHMTGFGPTAWNKGGNPILIMSTHHYEKVDEAEHKKSHVGIGMNHSTHQTIVSHGLNS